MDMASFFMCDMLFLMGKISNPLQEDDLDGESILIHSVEGVLGGYQRQTGLED